MPKRTSNFGLGSFLEKLSTCCLWAVTMTLFGVTPGSPSAPITSSSSRNAPFPTGTPGPNAGRTMVWNFWLLARFWFNWKLRSQTPTACEDRRGRRFTPTTPTFLFPGPPRNTTTSGATTPMDRPSSWHHRRRFSTMTLTISFAPSKLVLRTLRPFLPRRLPLRYRQADSIVRCRRSRTTTSS